MKNNKCKCCVNEISDNTSSIIIKDTLLCSTCNIIIQLSDGNIDHLTHLIKHLEMDYSTIQELGIFDNEYHLYHKDTLNNAFNGIDKIREKHLIERIKAQHRTNGLLLLNQEYPRLIVFFKMNGWIKMVNPGGQNTYKLLF